MNGALPPQFHGDLLNRARALLEEKLADLGGSREGELADDGVGGQFTPRLPGRSGNHVEDAGRDAGTGGEFAERQCRVGRCGRGTRHHGASRRKGGSGLAGYHGIREVPRGNAGHHAHRFLGDHDAAIGQRGRDHVAVRALAFFREPFDERCAVEDLAARLREGLALFRGHDDGEVFLMLEHQFVPPAQDVGALLGGQGTPGRIGRVGRLNGPTGLRRAEGRNPPDGFAPWPDR